LVLRRRDEWVKVLGVAGATTAPRPDQRMAGEAGMRVLVISALVVSAFGAMGCGGGAGGATADAVEDAAGDAADALDPGLKRIFLTTGRFNGDLGGPSGADEACEADDARPDGGAFKALLVGGGRQACVSEWCQSGPEGVDWVLAPNTSYVRVDGTPVFTTAANAVVVDYPLPNSVGAGLNYWAGLREPWVMHEENCDGWTTADRDLRGRVGWAEGTNEGWIQGGNFTCDISSRLLCVEQ